MTVTALFPTLLYSDDLNNPALLKELTTSCKAIAKADKAGQRWSKDNGYTGYTSYASLNDLPYRDPAFDDLKRILDKHAVIFAKACHFAMSRKPKLDSIWINILHPDGQHSGHIHPHSVISGTIYVEVPAGAGALRLEDPRLVNMMHAPIRSDGAPFEMQSFFTITPKSGQILLWESWLRHEVLRGTATKNRISISFNYS